MAVTNPDWARYMYENKDVYSMYSDGGKWDWDNGRQQNAYMRADGTPLQAETAAQYAQNHYRNFGKRAGRALHDVGSTDYAAKLRGSSAPAPAPAAAPSANAANAKNDEITTLQKKIADLTNSVSASMANPNNAAPYTGAEKPDLPMVNPLKSTILSNSSLPGQEEKKKRSYLTPITSYNV